MLATMGAPKDLHGDDWVFEAKWDGYRILSAVHNAGEQSSAVELRSRNGKDYTTVFPELSNWPIWFPMAQSSTERSWL